MKITGGKYNSRVIKTVEFENVKPTLSKIRQAIFNTLGTLISFDNKIFFDMFSGSGIMGIEALSRGFNSVFFEKDKKTANNIKILLRSLNFHSDVYFGDSIKNINKTILKADVIFLDPPYDSNLYEQSLNVIKECSKLNDNGIVVMEQPVEKIIDVSGYELLKEKSYGNKKITYLRESCGNIV